MFGDPVFFIIKSICQNKPNLISIDMSNIAKEKKERKKIKFTLRFEFFLLFVNFFSVKPE